jgi:hypothetical protein
MKSKIRYRDEPIGAYKVIEDFLPSPDQLVLKEDTVKVTLSLSKSSVAFFKKQAKKHHLIALSPALCSLSLWRYPPADYGRK